MNRLYDDMISTADSFAVNFSDRGTFDYSFDSLTLAEELLDEMADYIFEDDEAVYNASTMIGAYVQRMGLRPSWPFTGLKIRRMKL